MMMLRLKRLRNSLSGERHVLVNQVAVAPELKIFYRFPLLSGAIRPAETAESI
ncbi:hypothetical protein G9X64_25965 [Rhizobium sophorae]|uniref:Uncharacterized protein n=1 Tax=Rhizobium sophorae TaxID=1535242 RepID=A0A7Y3SA48_9HYPH|nr:hypothetical protein [Rhizobium sophorae]NNU39861.1 hypothetical protein [Rhizobium sophorae]